MLRHGTERARTAFAECLECSGSGADPGWKQAVAGWEALDRDAAGWSTQAEVQADPGNWPIAGAASDEDPELPEAELTLRGDIVVDGHSYGPNQLRIDVLKELRGTGDVIELHFHPEQTLAQVRAMLVDARKAGCQRVAVVAREPVYPYRRRVYWVADGSGLRANLRSDRLAVAAAARDRRGCRAGHGRACRLRIANRSKLVLLGSSATRQAMANRGLVAVALVPISIVAGVLSGIVARLVLPIVIAALYATLGGCLGLLWLIARLRPRSRRQARPARGSTRAGFRRLGCSSDLPDRALRRPPRVTSLHACSSTARTRNLPTARTSCARSAKLEAAKLRVERDAKNLLTETRKQLVGELLPVLDNVDRAIAAGEPNAVTGMQLVRRQLESVLRGYGVERIDAVGRTFDPQLHDAIATLPVTDPDQHRRVVDQIEPGYRFGDALLRPAKVVVGACAKRNIAPAEPDVVEPEPAAVSVEPERARLPALDPRYFRQPERVARPLHAPFAPFRVPHRVVAGNYPPSAWLRALRARTTPSRSRGSSPRSRRARCPSGTPLRTRSGSSSCRSPAASIAETIASVRRPRSAWPCGR